MASFTNAISLDPSYSLSPLSWLFLSWPFCHMYTLQVKSLENGCHSSNRLIRTITEQRPATFMQNQ